MILIFFKRLTKARQAISSYMKSERKRENGSPNLIIVHLKTFINF